MKRSLVLLLFVLPLSAQARVFDFNRESFAAYFAGGLGYSNLKDGATSKESGTNVSFSEESKYNYSGEFGFVYSHPRVAVRFGFELLSPSKVTGSTANNGTSDLYSVDSDITGYMPKLGIDINLRPTPQSRSYISLAAGAASVTMKNDYTYTAAGTAAFPGSATALEAKGTATMLSAALGHESLLSDTTTILFEIGYRRLVVDNLEYSKDVTIFNQTHSSGDSVLNVSGSQRELDLSGVFISLGFRFYL